VKISFDPAKREATLKLRGLDFADAGDVFAGDAVTISDERFDYGELRNITIGYLSGRCVVLVWTWRGESRRIISMRYAHGKEERHWFERGSGGMDRS
jgi:uncharacterized DUF497 family protein